MALAACLSPTLGPLLRERERARGFIDAMPVKQTHHASTGSVATSQISLAGTSTKALEHVPAEVFVEIYKCLDLSSALNLAATGRRCAAIFKSHRPYIVLEAIKEDFGPVEELLQLVVLTPSDLRTPWGTWLNKPLRRHKRILCEGGTLPEGWPALQGRLLYEQIQLEDKHVEKLLSICKVVKGWERIYPQYRFHDVPMSKRSLTATENERLRRALYAWMRYAFYFHGDLPRPLPYIASGTDVRVNQLRCLSNRRLRELQDLWMTVQDIIELKLCPSIETIQVNTDFELTRTEASRIGWGDGQENQKVIATMSKLSPAELLFYVDNSHKYTKKRLIQEIRAKHPSFESDTETLGIALSCVYSERYDTIVAEYGAPHHVMSSLWFPSRPLGDCCGGILDMDEPELEATSAQLKEMDGLKLAWRAEDPTRDVREEVPTGLLDI